MSKLARGGQFILIGIPENLDEHTRNTIMEVQPGGFILFGRNIGLPPIPDAEGKVGVPGSPEKLRATLDELRSLLGHEPVIAIDQEGGRVSRLRGLVGCAEPPSARQLAEKGDSALLERHGRLTGQLLRLFGINVNLCPVLDIAYDHDADNSLRNRCYGQTPEQVTRNARRFMQGQTKEGVLCTGKHFPGYSRATIDPHHELPVIERSAAELEDSDWIPYRALLPQLDFIMVGHAIYPQIDSTKQITSLSRKIITEILRERWSFPGLIISDDLDMGALTRHVKLEDSVQIAMHAGTDLLLLCHSLDRVDFVAESVGELPDSVLQPAEERLSAMRPRLSPPTTFSLERFNEISKEIQQLRRDTIGSDALSHTSGSGKIGTIEAAYISPVNTRGDREDGAGN